MSASQLFSFFWPVFSLAWLWFLLVNHLRIEWTLNPQYNYGWAVPFLCAYLIWEKRQGRKKKAESRNGPIYHLSSSIFYFLLVLCAMLYAPTRLIQEANPDWRLVSWALALEVVGITLSVLRFLQVSILRFPLSAFRFSDFVFPVCFFLMAVPWPTIVEAPLVQALTRAVCGFTVEILGLLGVPALRHGNVIELATGLLGVDEACSGIRSLQATLMISLFLGAIYNLSLIRRSIFCLTGFAIAFLFNVGRTLVLTLVAARKGIPAVASWHDPAGVAILLGCFICLWGIGIWLGKRKSGSESQPVECSKRVSTSDVHSQFSAFRFPLCAFALLVWLVIVEISVAVWYRSHEAKLPRAVQWTVAWPTQNATFKELQVPEKTRQLLRYDEGHNTGWSDGSVRWQTIFLRWNAGKTALYLARNHTPEICLPAAGRNLVSVSDQQWFEVNGLKMPFREYTVEEQGGTTRVYYCLWNDRGSEQGFDSRGLNYANRLGPVIAGLRNPGQRSIEIAVSGIADAEESKAALKRELQKLIKVPGP